jgi:hypothetical protein
MDKKETKKQSTQKKVMPAKMSEKPVAVKQPELAKAEIKEVVIEAPSKPKRPAVKRQKPATPAPQPKKLSFFQKLLKWL